MTLKNNTKQNIAITSLIAAIVITSGIGIAYAVPVAIFDALGNSIRGSLSVGQTEGANVNQITGVNSGAFGTGVEVQGDNSFGFGEFHFVLTDNGFTAGLGNSVSDQGAVAFGTSNSAAGRDSFAVGSGNLAVGDQSTAMGADNNSPGVKSFALGNLVTSQAFDSFIVGQCNELGTFNEIAWDTTDPLFIVGNGLASPVNPSQCDTRDNTFTIFKNGDIAVGKTNANSALDVNGYVELDIVNGAPPNEDCNANNERGRMKVSATDDILWVCVQDGWRVAQLLIVNND